MRSLANIFFLTFVGCVVTFNTNYPLITLEGLGEVQGSVTKSSWSQQRIYQFLGIPYAEAPSGVLRFKPPVPKRAWNKVLDVSQYGRRCPVISHLIETENQENVEDCLSLSVYTKNFKASAPVMFFIHGGGFYNGTYADHLPHYIMEKDIVLVVPQYRLGPLGWLSLQNKDISGNMGFMDVLAALEWVQTNIPTFGGNPSQVTIFGQSAGAVIVSFLTMSPGVPNGLFSRAIAASGSMFAPWAVNSRPLDLAIDVCKAVGCRKCASQIQIHQCLSKVSVHTLLKNTSFMSFSPSTNDFFGHLPVPPEVLAKTYKRKYPVMAGVCQQDGSFITAELYDLINGEVEGNWSGITVRDFINESNKSNYLGKPIAIADKPSTKFFFKEESLDTNNLKDNIPGYIDLHGMIAIKLPVLLFLQVSSESFKGDNYLYTFDYAGEHSKFGYGYGNYWYSFNGGIHHSNDNIYLWHSVNLNKNDTELAKKMIDLWTSFAITGKPSHGNVEIPKFNENGKQGRYFHIDKEITFGEDFFNEIIVSVTDPKGTNLIRDDIPWGTPV